MKASAKTLQNFLDLLPLVLARRYGPAFAVAAASEVLAEMETACDPDFFTGETGLLLASRTTTYRLPDSVRHIKGLYGVAAGEAIPDRGHPVAHQVLNGFLRLDSEPTISEDDDISGTVAVGAPADQSLLYDDTAGNLDGLEEDELRGRLARVTHASGVVEYRLLAGNDPAAYTATLDGPLAALAAAGDAYLVTANFLVIEHQRYLARPTEAAIRTAAIDVPQDFENLFRAGLTWKYHLQADSLSKETRTWGEQYALLMSNFRIDTSKVRGTATRNSPRSLPSLFN